MLLCVRSHLPSVEVTAGTNMYAVYCVCKINLRTPTLVVVSVYLTPGCVFDRRCLEKLIDSFDGPFVFVGI